MAVIPHGNVQQKDPEVRDKSGNSPVQASRLDHTPTLPTVLQRSFKLSHGPPTTAAGHPEEIHKLFPCLYGQPSVQLEQSAAPAAANKLKLGVVLSGGQAPRGHNVIAGFFDYLQAHYGL